MTDINALRVMPRHLTNWRGPALLVCDLRGLIRCGTEGFYYRQTRFLSCLEVTVDGKPPRPVAADPLTPATSIAYFIAPSPAGARAGPAAERDRNGGEIVRSGIEMQLDRSLGGGCRQRAYVINHTLADADIVLRWQLAADFADLSEAAKGERQQQALVLRSWKSDETGSELRLQYDHPQLNHASIIRFAGPGQRVDCGDAVAWKLHLKPQQPVTLLIDIAPVFLGEEIAIETELDDGGSGPSDTRLSAASPLVQAAWDRAVGDLASLALRDGEGDQKRMPAAGIPRYMAMFGRDVLVAGFHAGLIKPAMLRGSLELVAHWNATEYDDAYDAEPGRVIHQRQQSPLSLLKKNPFLHYYGDYTAPAWFLIDCAWYYLLGGDREFYRRMRAKILATLEWMERDADRDHDGFYEYATRAGDWGIKNQGWKDSEEAILYPDGEVVPNPLALADVQGAYYLAKQLTAVAFAALGDTTTAGDLLDQAAALKRRFNAAFWLANERYFALALDPDKNPVETIACDPGHCLAFGIIDDDKAAAVAERLMSPELFSGWGIRTLSNRHPAFNPFAYHLGSVWPASNGTTALGFKRYGFDAHLHRLVRAQLEACQLFETGRLPQVFGGHPRGARHPHPGIYPEANSPQAWSASATVQLVLAMLGLFAAAPDEALFVDPVLPQWLPEVVLHDLRIGDARVTLRFTRDASGRTECEIVARQGSLDIRRAEWGADRIAAMARALYRIS
ncbi:MAG TPA: glycogen debranching N-terminal domain-containing protein [Stellaceae bacterium]|nr:glycogen debranching N-terminal domain-containing protein [Stellaceae bacterium]